MFTPRKTTMTALAVTASILGLGSSSVRAEPAIEVHVTYADGQFQPAGLSAPAGKPLVIRVKNLDAKAMEFESTSLRVEKVVPAKSEGIINIRPLKHGRYEFYDDFNEKARGVLNAQ